MHCAETFTGFKWIGPRDLQHPELRFVFGYEQALGYLVAQRPLDKDGITAAVLMAEVAALAAAEGVTLQDRLDAPRGTGSAATSIADLSVRMRPGRRRGAGRRAARRPADRGRRPSRSRRCEWFEEAGLLRL